MGSNKVKNVHILDLKNITIKENSWIAKLAARKLKSRNVAIVLGKAIHLYNVSIPQFLADEKWVKHEACHLRQFRDNGNLTFVLKYLWQSILRGYHNNKYEAEARHAEEDLK